MAEFALIETIRQRCVRGRGDVVLGIGDDAAVVAVPPDCELVVCTDTLVAGVHFTHDTAAADIGWKSLAVNLSDLAAMGATPAWALLALTLPTADTGFVEGFADGFAALAAEHGVSLTGGDTTSGPLTITVTVHGFVPKGRALRRDRARVGDTVWVSGTLGDAAAALRERDSNGDISAESHASLRARLDRPQPRVDLGILLREFASSCIDISDGLLADLGHVATASGVGIEIDVLRLPASPALLDRVPMEQRHALQLAGGDDYELAFTVAPERIPLLQQAIARNAIPITLVGRVVANSGVRALDAEGRALELPRAGWEHFS